MQKQKTFKNIPVGILLFSAFYIFGVFVLLTSICSSFYGIAVVSVVVLFSRTVRDVSKR